MILLECYKVKDILIYTSECEELIYINNFYKLFLGLSYELYIIQCFPATVLCINNLYK